jgi:hypothetical protein
VVEGLIATWDEPLSPVTRALLVAGHPLEGAGVGAEVSFHEPAAVRELAAELAAFGPGEALARFEADPARWIPSPPVAGYPTDADAVRAWIRASVLRLQLFYREAAEAGDAVLVAVV